MPHQDTYHDGKRMPSVTEIINIMDKPWKWNWYKNSVMKKGKAGWMACERAAQTGRDLGTLFHDKVYLYIQHQKMPRRNEKMRPMLDSFKRWYDNCGMTPIELEPDPAKKSLKYWYSGTYDAMMKVNNTDLVVPADWKSSNSSDKNYGLQLSAYAMLYGESQGWDEETLWKRMPRGLMVRVDKRSYKVETRWFEGLRYYFEVFKGLRLAYDFSHKLGGWEEPK